MKKNPKWWNNWRKTTLVSCDRMIRNKLVGKLFIIMIRHAILDGLENVPMTENGDWRDGALSTWYEKKG